MRGQWHCATQLFACPTSNVQSAADDQLFSELWALPNFALRKAKSFDEWFNTPFSNSGIGEKIELNDEETLLHKVLCFFLLRLTSP